MFPEQRLHTREDGQLAGNVIVDSDGQQHPLDNHQNFHRRISNYIVGTNPIVLATNTEIAIARKETLEALRDILKKNGKTPFDIVGHYGMNLSETQVNELRSWLCAVKKKAKVVEDDEETRSG